MAINREDMPPFLRLCNLRCTAAGNIDTSKIQRLSAIELMIDLYYVQDKTVDAISAVFKQRRVPCFDDFSVMDLKKLTKKQCQWARRSIKQARRELIEALNGFFFVPDAKDMLWNWVEEAGTFSSGRRVEAVNHKICKGNRRLAHS